MNSTGTAEWSRFYRFGKPGTVDILHARFVTHRYTRHAHEHLVVGLVERGAQSYSYRGARHVTPAGRMFLVNPGEPHTGEASTPTGYVYRTLYPETGLPPHGYLEGVRMREARERLDRGESIAATALAVGYSDQSHLTRRFKRFLGVTPGQYLRETRGKIRQDAAARGH